MEDDVIKSGGGGNDDDEGVSDNDDDDDEGVMISSSSSDDNGSEGTTRSSDDDKDTTTLRISPVQHPNSLRLVEEPGETQLDDTDQLALGAPPFRRREVITNILTAEREVVRWYKQLFVGKRCECEREDSIIKTAYCTECFSTGVVGGYQSHGYVRLLSVHIEWGESVFTSPGLLETNIDFEYSPTPGDFFELGRVVDDTAFHPDAEVGERHEGEGVVCLWRVLDVGVVHDEEDFPLFWGIRCKNVERYEPMYGWWLEKSSNDDGGNGP